MNDNFHITLPNEVTEEQLESIKAKLHDIETIKSIDSVATRAIADGNLIIWVQLVGGVLSAVSNAVPFILKIIKIIRNKGILSAQIKLPNGIEISTDKSSAEEIINLLEALEK